MSTQLVAVSAICGLMAAACSGSGSETAVLTVQTAQPTTTLSSTADTTAAPTTTIDPAATAMPDESTAVTDAPITTIDPAETRTVQQINEYIEQAASFDQAGADAQFPAGLTFAAGGAPGYSRYVFRENASGVVPTLVEGPLVGTTRCQDTDLPCSYRELTALHELGEAIPDELAMTATELARLVAQLDELNAFAVAHGDIDAACAAGFVSDRIQTPNMGTHLYNVAWLGDGFDPSRPEILLYALADDTVPDGPVGQCVEGAWLGEPMQLVGTSFLIPPSVIGDQHPDTFAGPLDNWHIHYNLCRGATEGRDSFLPRSECEAAGGNFSAALGWMIHAWVEPNHDNDLGVFSMWNPTVAPRADGSAIAASRQVRGSDFPDGSKQSLITDFVYQGDLTVAAGQPLFFNNVDAVPHTVSGGTFDSPALDDFDSGLLDPGSNFEVSFDTPGVYSLFCTLHPDMTASVTVTANDGG